MGATCVHPYYEKIGKPEKEINVALWENERAYAICCLCNEVIKLKRPVSKLTYLDLHWQVVSTLNCDHDEFSIVENSIENSDEFSILVQHNTTFSALAECKYCGEMFPVTSKAEKKWVNGIQKLLATKWENGLDILLNEKQKNAKRERKQIILDEINGYVSKNKSKVNQIAQENKNANNNDNCKICFENIEQHSVLIPCGHAQFCYGCVKDCKKCPICRKQVDNCYKTFVD